MFLADPEAGQATHDDDDDFANLNLFEAHLTNARQHRLQVGKVLAAINGDSVEEKLVPANFHTFEHANWFRPTSAPLNMPNVLRIASSPRNRARYNPTYAACGYS